jgi:hypothetical protein
MSLSGFTWTSSRADISSQLPLISCEESVPTETVLGISVSLVPLLFEGAIRAN